MYKQQEQVRYLALNLIWKPVRRQIRFILVESSRGRIVLMTDDLSLDPLMAIQLYSHRVTIETLFDSVKNILGGMGYRFWSKYLKSASRRPKKNEAAKAKSTAPDKTRKTFDAIEKFFAIHLVVLGVLQLLSRRFSSEIHKKAHCWLRTPTGDTPSIFVTRTALSNVLRANLLRVAKDLITQLILKKQDKAKGLAASRKAS